MQIMEAVPIQQNGDPVNGAKMIVTFTDDGLLNPIDDFDFAFYFYDVAGGDLRDDWIDLGVVSDSDISGFAADADIYEVMDGLVAAINQFLTDFDSPNFRAWCTYEVQANQAIITLQGRTKVGAVTPLGGVQAYSFGYAGAIGPAGQSVAPTGLKP